MWCTKYGPGFCTVISPYTQRISAAKSLLSLFLTSLLGWSFPGGISAGGQYTELWLHPIGVLLVGVCSTGKFRSSTTFTRHSPTSS